MNDNSANRVEVEWQSFIDAKTSWRSAADTLQHENVFSRGYILTKAYDAVPKPDHWFSAVVGEWQLAFDPRQPVSIRRNSEAKQYVIILGHVFDSQAGITEIEKISVVLQAALPRPGVGWDRFDRLIEEFGGRFVIIGVSGNETRVHVDAMATKSCYWYSEGKQVVLASHSALIAELLNKHDYSGVQWIMKHPDYKNPAGKTLPGLIQPHDVANLVFANCALLISGSETRHERFFPREPLASRTIAFAASEFIEELRFQIDAWSNVANKHILALTAGRDSRAILAAGLDLYKKSNTVAMSYHFFARNAKTTQDDLFGANKLALFSGMPHIIQDVRPLTRGTRTADLYTRTFPTWARFPTLAGTFYDHLPADATLTLGVGAGIGTAFYQNRSIKEISPELLARKFALSKVQDDPKLIAQMQKYINYTDFHEERFFNYDFHDLYHWEHRIGKWAAVGHSEYDLSVIPAVPLNSRKLLKAMLSVPYEDQVNKTIYEVLQDFSSISPE